MANNVEYCKLAQLAKCLSVWPKPSGYLICFDLPALDGTRLTVEIRTHLDFGPCYTKGLEFRLVFTARIRFSVNDL